MNKSLALVVIILIALFLRIILLKEVPPGLANDELNIIMNAQSLLKTGQSIPGVITGFFGTTRGDLSGGIHSEISSYLIIPGIILFGFNLIGVKTAFILTSLGLIYISYLLVKRMINVQAGLIAAFLAAINPWSIQFGRSGYESIFSAFFYLTAIYLMITLKKWKILWSILLLILGFLSYFSAKTLLLPIVLVTLIIFKFLKTKETLKPILTVTVLIIFFLLLYIPLLQQSAAGARFQELKNQNVKDIVNLNRKASIETSLNQIFENKITENFNIRAKASLATLSPTFLFLDGQPESIPSLSIPNHGPLFLIDLPLIFLGIIYLARSNLPFLFYLLGLIIITLVPNFLNLAGTTYMIRTVILFPLLTIFSAIGIYSLISFKEKLIKVSSIILIITTYSFFFGNFLYQYFARLPIEKDTGWFLHQRILSKYVKLNSLENKFQIKITSTEPKQLFYRYLFFNNFYENSTRVDYLNKKIADQEYTLENLIISEKCPDITSADRDTYIVDTSMNCTIPNGDSIASLKDGGDKYIIINDRLCNTLTKNPYPLIKNFSKLNIESLSKEDLCINYIINHSNI